MELFFNRLSIGFNQNIKGILEDADTGKERSFKVEMAARGREYPQAGSSVTGTVSIEGRASERPLFGTITGAGDRHYLSFEFKDDQLNGNRFEGAINNRYPFGSGPVRGSIFGDGNQGPWAKTKSASTERVGNSLSSLRVELRPRRPVFKDRARGRADKKPRPLPMRRIAILIAETVFPPGDLLDGGGEATVERIEKSAAARLPLLRWALGLAFFEIEWLAVLGIGKRFSRAGAEERVKWLEKMESKPLVKMTFFSRIAFTPLRPLMVAVISLLKFFNINTDEAHARLRTEMNLGGMLGPDDDKDGEKFAPDPIEAWAKQVKPASGFDADLVIEADAVVVGTGAGGGPAAKELAGKGFAVAIIEGGKLYRREDSTFGSMEGTVALGNSLIFLPTGKAVGGSTFVNAGTCFHTPPEVLMEWVGKGMPELHPDKMAPYFERVDAAIKVAEAEPKYVGPVGEVIKKGCDRLEYSSMNLRRNAYECEGKAVCTQGCPHGAKQSTNRSYIPDALKSKATLFTEFLVRDILTNGDRAIGVHAYGKGVDGKTVRLTVFARAVVLGAGTLRTPVLMQRNNLVRGNKWVGANLSFHPATAAAGVVPGVEMRTHQSIPQGYCVDEFKSEGLMFEGGSLPLIGWALMQRGVGKKYMDTLEKFPNMANFGYLVEDTSRGRIRPGIGDAPLVTYWMNKKDLHTLVRGMAIVSRIFFAAGAERVFTATINIHEMRSEEDVDRFESGKWRPRDFILSAFHPLGTTRAGPDPRTSVVDLDHQCHQVPGLFVVDGSAVPTSVGVNSQVTIMAMATRAADRIAEVLSRQV